MLWRRPYHRYQEFTQLHANEPIKQHMTLIRLEDSTGCGPLLGILDARQSQQMDNWTECSSVNALVTRPGPMLNTDTRRLERYLLPRIRQGDLPYAYGCIV